MNISEINSAIEKKQIRLDMTKDELRLAEEKMVSCLEELDRQQEARDLMQTAAQVAQQQLAEHLSSMVSLALSSVFSDPYEFSVLFEAKRNTTECSLSFVKNGNHYDPMNSCGYGAADVASFALRMAYWSLRPSAPILVWDEPFRHLSKSLQEKAAEMIKTLSQKLGIQVIIITHSDELAESADKLFFVKMKNGKSVVTEKE